MGLNYKWGYAALNWERFELCKSYVVLRPSREMCLLGVTSWSWLERLESGGHRPTEAHTGICYLHGVLYNGATVLDSDFMSTWGFLDSCEQWEPRWADGGSPCVGLDPTAPYSFHLVFFLL